MGTRRNYNSQFKKEVKAIYKKRKEQGLNNYQIAARLGMTEPSLMAIVGRPA